MSGDDLKLNVQGNGGCLGCLGTIVIIVLIWAVLFGVTINGKHYGISSCSCNRGVEIDR